MADDCHDANWSELTGYSVHLLVLALMTLRVP